MKTRTETRKRGAAAPERQGEMGRGPGPRKAKLRRFVSLPQAAEDFGAGRGLVRDWSGTGRGLVQVCAGRRVVA